MRPPPARRTNDGGHDAAAAALRAGDSAGADRLEVPFDRDEEAAKTAANSYGLGDCGA
jgi:hypothetical protein